MKRALAAAALAALTGIPAAHAQTPQPQGTPRVITSADVTCQPVDRGTQTFFCLDQTDAIEFDIHETSTSTWIEVWPVS